MANIVLVGGAWIGAWAWRAVTPELRAAGHQVYPLTLTGFGDRAHLGTPETDLSDHVQDVIAAIEAEELTDVVLVGHSYAGSVVTVVADRIPERLAKVIYVAGVTPEHGKRLFDLIPGVEEIMQAMADAEGDGWRIPFISDETLDLYYGEHGLTGQHLGWLRTHAHGVPIATHREVIKLATPDSSPVPRVFVHCTGDGPAHELPHYGRDWVRAEIATGHWPMATKPVELAALLDRLVVA
ncbi:alpha/beta fold hydrolase [Crossiella cryophila]|uniref:Pimeloyl-ACP methyl ester carboxylesterase n=1 Tax=Crossiella cryophila TaxID=43355 RepID=A0A7W7CDU9_9PSEU|nr:alpha/beta fold hydrolase [Crossiella cryophila]MBB4679360.1 pimeloyl-ACP methyl ester carboxylesterase [Crossiella cryophila]